MSAPAAPAKKCVEMQKQLVQTGKLFLGQRSGIGGLGTAAVAVIGVALLAVEGVLLTAQGIPGVAYALVAVFVASIVSSIAGCTK